MLEASVDFKVHFNLIIQTIKDATDVHFYLRFQIFQHRYILLGKNVLITLQKMTKRKIESLHCLA